MNKDTSQNNTSMKVLIRVRPLVTSQKDTRQIIEIQRDNQNKTLKIYHDTINHIQSKFDQIIGKQQTQVQVFKIFQPYIKRIFNGFNLTIFAYGQTGSGKTHTMFGSDWQNFVEKSVQMKKQMTYFNQSELDNNFTGIIPRSIYAIFKQFQTCKDRYQVFCSFLQIYNQKIYDLLQDSPTPKALNIHESKVNGIFVQGLTQFQVQHFVDCLNLMRQGQKNRVIRQTSMNAKSSRSHTIFQILIESTSTDNSGNYTKARLNLCDLAGSQKINKNQNMINEHLQQLKNINLSLTTLGKVIYSLSSGKKANVAAFRQSKLTRLLQQSLTINTNTFIIGNISPSQKNLDETINTLKFAQRASHITMKVKPIDFNQLNPDSVNKLKRQIQYLKNLLNLKKKGVSQQQLNEQLKQLDGQNQKNKNDAITPTQFQKLLKENRNMKKQIYQLQNNLEQIRGETNFNMTSRTSRSSSNLSNNYTQTQFQSKEELRREIYLKKFLNGNGQTTPIKTDVKRQTANHSVLVTAGKATIDQESYENQKKQKYNIIAKKEKLNILKKFEKIESSQNHKDSLILEELENIYNGPGHKKMFQKQSNIINAAKNNLNSIPKRYHEANVFRRGKMSLQKGSLDNARSPQGEQNGLMKKKKIDYNEKIKQLESRLYRK